MSRWPTVALAETATAKGLVGGPFGSSLVGTDYVESGVPVIRGTNLNGGRELRGDYVFVSDAKVSSDLSRNVAEPGDLVFTQRGTLGQLALVPSKPYPRYVVSQSQMRLRVDPEIASSNYLFYACSAPSFLQQINDNAIATGVPHINLGILARLEVPFPRINEQRAIAEVLGALDDKIAANTATVDLLVQHQEAEYEISLLRGLESQLLDEVADFHNRKRVPLSAKERDERPGSVPYYGATGIFGSVDQSLFNDNLVLVGEDGSVITPCGLPVIQYIWGPAWVNNHAHVLTGRSVSTELLRFALARTNVASLVTGAVQPKISMGKLKGLVLVLPTSDELLRLEQLVASEMALLRGTSDETKTLVAMRDALLPLLMSGKIRVKDAEQMVGDVV